jgi:hypothetical protein
MASVKSPRHDRPIHPAVSASIAPCVDRLAQHRERILAMVKYRFIWRIYCSADNVNREFGRDYTRAEAVSVTRQYRAIHPAFIYRIRKVRVRVRN